MEYTKSVDKDGEVFERFEGTPEEIAKLIRLLGRTNKTNEGLKHLSPTKSLTKQPNAMCVISPDTTVNIPGPEGPCLEDLNKKVADQVLKGFKTMKANTTP